MGPASTFDVTRWRKTCGMVGSIENDALLHALAATSGGVCTRTALLDAGFGRSSIDRRLRQGVLSSVCRGVYIIEALRDRSTPSYRALAAVPGSVLAHHTAAALHRFPVDVREDVVHVIVPNGVHRRVGGVVVHPSRTLSSFDIVEVDGVPCTSPARTIVDLAGVVGKARLRHIVQTQLRDAKPGAVELQSCFDATARQGVPGVLKLRRLVVDLLGDASGGEGSDLEGSELEARVWALLATQGITGFGRQVRPPWFDGRRGIVDFAHGEAKVVLEADGRRWHQRDQEMTDDRRRDRLAAAHGWVAIRVTWAEVTQRPAATAASIAAVVDQRLQTSSVA